MLEATGREKVVIVSCSSVEQQKTQTVRSRLEREVLQIHLLRKIESLRQLFFLPRHTAHSRFGQLRPVIRACLI